VEKQLNALGYNVGKNLRKQFMIEDISSLPAHSVACYLFCHFTIFYSGGACDSKVTVREPGGILCNSIDLTFMMAQIYLKFRIESDIKCDQTALWPGHTSCRNGSISSLSHIVVS